MRITEVGLRRVIRKAIRQARLNELLSPTSISMSSVEPGDALAQIAADELGVSMDSLLVAYGAAGSGFIPMVHHARRFSAGTETGTMLIGMLGDSRAVSVSVMGPSGKERYVYVTSE